MADKNAGHSFDFDPFNPPSTTTATATPHRSSPRQLASGQTRPIEHISQQRRSPVLPGDPNLDPFYLERALERESHVRDQFDQPFTSSPVRYDHRGNVPPLSLTRSQPPETPSHALSGVQQRGFESSRSRYPPSGAGAAPASCSQSSCSSLQSDATTLTPDLTPSSSFSSTYSGQNYLEDVWKATEPLTLHDRSYSPPHRSPTAASNAASHQLYLPLTPSDDQPDPWTSSTTVQMSTPRLRSANTSSETLTMDPKPDSSPPPPLPPPPPPSPAYLHSKPLPCLPSSSPSMATLAPLTPPKKVFSSGSRSQIDPTSISSPILLNPVTLEPHSSHLDCAFFIPANGYPSVVAKAAATDPEATPPPTAQSRASTLTSNVNGEQSVWESDSDSGSGAPRSQTRRTPIETLRKVRSRVQLRRAAKSEDKLATEPSNDGSTQEKMPALPPLDPRVSNGLPPPAKQTALRLTPSSSLLSPPPSSSSRKGGDRSGDEVNTFTAAAVHAKTRRRRRVDGPLDDPSSPSSKDENCDGYSHSHSHHTSDQAADLTLGRPGMFKRVWGSLQTLNCQSNRMTRKPSYRKTL